jgi:hypothetical protein
MGEPEHGSKRGLAKLLWRDPSRQDTCRVRGLLRRVVAVRRATAARASARTPPSRLRLRCYWGRVPTRSLRVLAALLSSSPRGCGMATRVELLAAGLSWIGDSVNTCGQAVEARRPA